MDREQAAQFMTEAIREGRKAREKCRPNPPVGCVLVRDGAIISRGHTNEPGGPHAEAMALSQLKGSLDDVIAFVTLEPCSFHGRTPSCAEELVKRQIRELYVGMIDPHPRNQGAGIDILREARVPVQLGLLENEVRRDLQPYLVTSS